MTCEEPHGLRPTDTRFSVSGTTKCLLRPMMSSRRSPRHLREARPGLPLGPLRFQTGPPSPCGSGLKIRQGFFRGGDSAIVFFVRLPNWPSAFAPGAREPLEKVHRTFFVRSPTNRLSRPRPEICFATLANFDPPTGEGGRGGKRLALDGVSSGGRRESGGARGRGSRVFPRSGSASRRRPRLPRRARPRRAALRCSR